MNLIIRYLVSTKYRRYHHYMQDKYVNIYPHDIHTIVYTRSIYTYSIYAPRSS